MQNVSKIEFILAMAQWRLAQSISHMRDQTDIDQRTYMLTINLERKSTPSVIADNCYQTIKHHLKFGRTGDTPQHRLPSLLWSYDASGSRTGRISDLTAHPHIHAVLILPTKLSKNEFDIFVRSLEQNLEQLPGVASRRGASKPVDLKPFVVRTDNELPSAYEQLVSFCSYALKGEAFLSISHQHSADFLSSGILPFDRLHYDAQETLKTTVERIFNNLGHHSTRFRHISGGNISDPVI